MVSIKLLFVILDEGKSKKINHTLNKYDINAKVVSNAAGTASPSLLDYFGLIETKKEIFMAIIPDTLETKILRKLNTDFRLTKEGTGVAFTIPISSANKYLSEHFSDDEKEVKEEMEKIKAEYHLIITIVLEGYLNQVMNAAKRVGATGGTVIKGRGLGGKKATKVLGFNIEPEREVILNIVEDKDRQKVMEEITKEVGIKTPGKGICISLPVSHAIGFKSEKKE